MIITQTLTVKPSDKANGVCTAMIKESGEDYGKWRTHACRNERPYMCKKALNSKIQTLSVINFLFVLSDTILCMIQLLMYALSDLLFCFCRSSHLSFWMVEFLRTLLLGGQ